MIPRPSSYTLASQQPPLGRHRGCHCLHTRKARLGLRPIRKCRVPDTLFLRTCRGPTRHYQQRPPCSAPASPPGPSLSLASQPGQASRATLSLEESGGSMVPTGRPGENPHRSAHGSAGHESCGEAQCPLTGEGHTGGGRSLRRDTPQPRGSAAQLDAGAQRTPKACSVQDRGTEAGGSPGRTKHWPSGRPHQRVRNSWTGLPWWRCG